MIFLLFFLLSLRFSFVILYRHYEAGIFVLLRSNLKTINQKTH